MSSQRLFPKDRQTECEHHTLMIRRQRISRVPCRTVVNADSMAGGAAALSSSLCSSVVSDCSDDRADAEDKADNSHVKDKDNGQHGNNPIESPKEAQDGTIGGVDAPT